MSNLENILAINAAINLQKRNKIEIFPVVEDLLNKNSPDLSARVEDKRDFLPKPDENLFEKSEKAAYSPFKVFSEYLSAFKDKIYGYYSSIKESIKKGINKGGYTDKLLKEIEDWGVIYFRTVFQNLKRITPLGQIHRYMQHLWICQTKNIK